MNEVSTLKYGGFTPKSLMLLSISRNGPSNRIWRQSSGSPRLSRHQNYHFQRTTGKWVYLPEYLLWQVAWPLKWKLVSCFIKVDYIYRKAMLLSAFFPCNIRGNNGNKDLWRHSDVTWSDFHLFFRKRFSHLRDDSVKIWSHLPSPNGSYY